jgi:hypothetical protein
MGYRGPPPFQDDPHDLRYWLEVIGLKRVKEDPPAFHDDPHDLRYWLEVSWLKMVI